MKVYLAAPYAARDRIREHAEQLRALGFEVTSSWLDEQHQINAGTTGAAAALDDKVVSGHALDDLDDVRRSDLVVLFTAPAAGLAPADGGSGGRHVETGYALADWKPIVVVGEPENIFQRIGLPLVQLVTSWGDAVDSLLMRRRGECVVCGCTMDRACEGGCWWAGENVCSRCA